MDQETVTNMVMDVLTSHLSSKDDINVEKTIKNMIVRSNPYSIHIFNDDKEFLINKIHIYLNKSWETIFGNILEDIQIKVSGGIKSKEIGFDIDLPNNKFIGSKSGPNWANSDQRKSILRNSKYLVENKNAKVYVVCSYGKGKKNYKYYTQVSGQSGWELLTNDTEMYYKIDIALKENKSVLQEIKNKVCGNIEKQSIYFWEKNFYSDNKFDNKKYLDYVSKK